MIERWWVDEQRKSEYRNSPSGPLRVSAWMQPAPGRTILSSDRQSAAVLFAGDTPLLVKWRCPLASRAKRTFLRASRERLEARAALQARALGIETPAPWAVGELRHCGTLLGAVLVRGFDVSAHNAGEAARTRPEVIDVCAAALATWHERGFRHGDCYLKNILLDETGARPSPIGFPKARFVQPGATVDRARRKDLAQFAAGIAELDADGDPFGFLPAYVQAAEGLPPAESLAAQVRPAFERIMARKRDRIASRPTREPDGPPAPKPLPPGFGETGEMRLSGLAQL